VISGGDGHQRNVCFSAFLSLLSFHSLATTSVSSSRPSERKARRWGKNEICSELNTRLSDEKSKETPFLLQFRCRSSLSGRGRIVEEDDDGNNDTAR
jgi:hypothetical protein